MILLKQKPALSFQAMEQINHTGKECIFNSILTSGNAIIKKVKGEKCMKLCIGLCDENPLHLRMIAQEIRRLGRIREIETEIYTWTCGSQLLQEAESSGIQLYLLEIKMPDMSGIEVAKQLNQLQPSAQIIFISDSLEPVCDIYETEHLYFILKSQLARRLPDALDRALMKLGKAQKGVSFMLHSRRQVTPIPLHSIVCIEKELRKIIITTTHERYEMYAKLQDALASLPPNDFVQCHRSYIVAFRHIEQICGNEILLSNGQRLPIGRTFMQPLKEALMQRQFSS